jgi:hypothetical protein
MGRKWGNITTSDAPPACIKLFITSKKKNQCYLFTSNQEKKYRYIWKICIHTRARAHTHTHTPLTHKYIHKKKKLKNVKKNHGVK